MREIRPDEQTRVHARPYVGLSPSQLVGLSVLPSVLLSVCLSVRPSVLLSSQPFPVKALLTSRRLKHQSRKFGDGERSRRSRKGGGRNLDRLSLSRRMGTSVKVKSQGLKIAIS